MSFHSRSSFVSLPELTLRGCIIATLITIVFTASNIYLGLKVGLTFSSAIPSAVISMAVLKLFKNSNILENCAVQTFASSAGTLSAVIFILPAMVMIGYWNGFPFWQTMLVCLIGGLLGVMYSIPLRRALVLESDLPFPEGVAAAEVLKLGSPSTIKSGQDKDIELANKISGARDIYLGGTVSAFFMLLSQGMHFLSGSLATFMRVGSSVAGISSEYSLALIGAGYLVGIRIALSIVIGLLIGWGIAVPFFSAHMVAPAGASLTDFAMQVWSTKVRYLGVGMIAVAAIWTIIILLRPIGMGLSSSWQAMKARRIGDEVNIPATERDIPLGYVIGSSVLLMIPMAWLYNYFINIDHFSLASGLGLTLIISGVLFTIIFGFLVASIAGYMAGITGSSNSPVSGIAVLVTISSSLLMSYIFSSFMPHISTISSQHLIMGLAIFITSVIIAIGCISNDNLQDLKTGHLVGATPWKQQTALILGVTVGALVIPPLLEMMYHAYGFMGAALPNPGMKQENALAAPQAVLMTTLAQGIVQHNMHWNLLFSGAAIAIALILIDVIFLKKYGRFRISIISVGVGLYLPMEIDVPLVIGAFISYFANRRIDLLYPPNYRESSIQRDGFMRRGVLIASGFIVGESLLGVIMAAIILTTGNATPLKLIGNNFANIADVLGFIVFFGICYSYYRYVVRPIKK